MKLRDSEDTMMMVEREAPATRQAGRITDARDHTVSQLDPVMMHLLHRPGVIPRDVLRDIASEVGFGITRATRGMLWASVAGLACLVIALAICIFRFKAGTITTSRFLRNMLPYSSALCGLFTCWFSLRNARHQRVAKVLLQHRRCPHCGYPPRLRRRAPHLRGAQRLAAVSARV